jgi:hypothetical protein
MVYGEQDTIMGFILYDELDIVKVIKTGRFIWPGRLFGMHELDPCGQLNVLKPEGTRRIGRPESVEED